MSGVRYPTRQEDLLRAMAAPCPRCGFGEQFCRAVITGKGDLSIAKGYRTTIERCLESFDKAPDGKDLALRVAASKTHPFMRRRQQQQQQQQQWE